jgi:hypothetical protein
MRGKIAEKAAGGPDMGDLFEPVPAI